MAILDLLEQARKTTTTSPLREAIAREPARPARLPGVSPPPQPRKTGFFPGLESGLLQARAGGRGFLAGAAALVGADQFAEEQLREAQVLQEQAAQRSTLPDVTKLSSLSDVLDYVTTLAGQQAPNLAITAASTAPFLRAARGTAAVATAPLREQLAQAGTTTARKAIEKQIQQRTARELARGAGTGALVGSTGLEFGEIFPQTAEAARQQGHTLREAALASLPAALAAGALDAIPVRLGAGRLLRGESRGLRKAVTGAVRTAAEEAATEGAQTVIENVPAALFDPSRTIVDPNEILQSAVAGAVIGGGLHATGSVAAASKDPLAKAVRKVTESVRVHQVRKHAVDPQEVRTSLERVLGLARDLPAEPVQAVRVGDLARNRRPLARRALEPYLKPEVSSRLDKKARDALLDALVRYHERVMQGDTSVSLEDEKRALRSVLVNRREAQQVLRRVLDPNNDIKQIRDELSLRTQALDREDKPSAPEDEANVAQDELSNESAGLTKVRQEDLVANSLVVEPGLTSVSVRGLTKNLTKEERAIRAREMRNLRANRKRLEEGLQKFGFPVQVQHETASAALDALFPDTRQDEQQAKNRDLVERRLVRNALDKPSTPKVVKDHYQKLLKTKGEQAAKEFILGRLFVLREMTNKDALAGVGVLLPSDILGGVADVTRGGKGRRKIVLNEADAEDAAQIRRLDERGVLKATRGKKQYVVNLNRLVSRVLSNQGYQLGKEVNSATPEEISRALTAGLSALQSFGFRFNKKELESLAPPGKPGEKIPLSEKVVFRGSGQRLVTAEDVFGKQRRTRGQQIRAQIEKHQKNYQASWDEVQSKLVTASGMLSKLRTRLVTGRDLKPLMEHRAFKRLADLLGAMDALTQQARAAREPGAQSVVIAQASGFPFDELDRFLRVADLLRKGNRDGLTEALLDLAPPEERAELGERAERSAKALLELPGEVLSGLRRSGSDKQLYSGRKIIQSLPGSVEALKNAQEEIQRAKNRSAEFKQILRKFVGHIEAREFSQARDLMKTAKINGEPALPTTRDLYRPELLKKHPQVAKFLRQEEEQQLETQVKSERVNERALEILRQASEARAEITGREDEEGLPEKVLKDPEADKRSAEFASAEREARARAREEVSREEHLADSRRISELVQDAVNPGKAPASRKNNESWMGMARKARSHFRDAARVVAREIAKKRKAGVKVPESREQGLRVQVYRRIAQLMLEGKEVTDPTRIAYAIIREQDFSEPKLVPGAVPKVDITPRERRTGKQVRPSKARKGPNKQAPGLKKQIQEEQANDREEPIKISSMPADSTPVETREIKQFIGPYRFLSNFFRLSSPVVLDGESYPTVEHAYQAAKTLDHNERSRIRQLKTAKEAKRAGRRVHMRPDWGKVKVQIMEDLVRQKFTNNPDLADKLLSTGASTLIEGNTWNDVFWGVNLRTGKGRNELGKILMRIREELRRNPGIKAEKENTTKPNFVKTGIPEETILFTNAGERVSRRKPVPNAISPEDVAPLVKQAIEDVAKALGITLTGDSPDVHVVGYLQVPGLTGYPLERILATGALGMSFARPAEGKVYVAFNTDLLVDFARDGLVTEEDILRVVAHEFGHAEVSRVALRLTRGGDPNAEKLLKDLVRGYVRWNEMVTGQELPVEEATELFFSAFDLIMRARPEDKVSEVPERSLAYMFSVNEWLAENISRAVTRRVQAKTPAQKFFLDLANRLMRLAEIPFGDKPPAPVVEEFIAQAVFYNRFRVYRFLAERAILDYEEDEFGKQENKAFDGILRASGMSNRDIAPLAVFHRVGLTRVTTGERLQQTDITRVLKLMEKALTVEERNVLARAFQTPKARAQIREAMSKARLDPGVAMLLDGDPFYQAAAGYLLWVRGDLQLYGPRGKSVLGKFDELINETTGKITDDIAFAAVTTRLREVMVMTGLGRELPSAVGSEARRQVELNQVRKVDLKTMSAVDDPVSKIATSARLLKEKISKFVAPVLYPAMQRVYATRNPHLIHLAEQVGTFVGHSSFNRSYMELRRVNQERFLNAYRNIFKDEEFEDPVFLEETIRLLQDPGRKAPTRRHELVRKRIWRLLRRGYNYGVKAGLNIGDLGESYFPWVLDLEYLTTHHDEFIELLLSDPAYKEHIKDERAAELLYQNLLNNEGYADVEERELDPGVMEHNPFFGNMNTRELKWIMGGSPESVSRFTEFLSKDLHITMFSYLSQLTKRAEFTRKFGPNGKKVADYIARAKQAGAADADINLALDLVSAAVGTLGSTTNVAITRVMRRLGLTEKTDEQARREVISPRLRGAMTKIMTAANLSMLALSTLSSLVDPLGISVRASSFTTMLNALRRQAREIYDATDGNKKKLDELARTAGVITDTMTEEMMTWTYGVNYMSPTTKKVNDTFFRLIGLEGWTRLTRQMAVAGAMEFIKYHAVQAREGDKKSLEYLAELGLTPKDVVLDKHGDLQIRNPFDGSVPGRRPSKKTRVRNERLVFAINRFVDQSILRPNPAQRPIWASDPHFMLLFHMKSFMYGFYDVILRRVVQQKARGDISALLLLLLYIPGMMLADLFRNLIMHGEPTNPHYKTWSFGDYVMHEAERAGLLGLNQIWLDAEEDVRRGGIGIESILGPDVSLIRRITGKAYDGKPIEAASQVAPGHSVWKHWIEKQG